MSAMITHGFVVQGCREPCACCPAKPPRLCQCAPDGVHMCRVYLATKHQCITWPDLAALEHELGIFGGHTLLLDMS